jgi:NADH:ubiquinone oxidoreductase subunit F (NADH-binding)/NADH:ubiquinone oxidoreductase subunit E
VEGTATPPKRRGPRPGPRGRTAGAAAQSAVAAAVEGLAPRRDLLIEHLHRLQDRHRCLRAGHLVALAEHLRMAPVEVFEVASFYHHFEVLEDAAPAPEPITIRVRESLPCALAGAHGLIAALRAEPPGQGVHVESAPCVGACHRAPAVALGHELVEHATPASVAAAVADGPPALADPPDLESYLARGGYAALRTARRNEEGARDALLAALDAGALRGLGGAGFPAARKWKLVMAQPGPRHVVVNADEGEPGTFKDRYCLEKEPHRMLEGMLVAAHAIEAEACWIYLRDEYPHLRRMLEREIAALAAGIADKPIHLRRGAGAYICGEETALLESLEGRRGYPRHKPPFPGEHGLFGRPTLIHNVETLWLLPEILAEPGAAAHHATMGRRGGKGVRFFSVSGRVRQPGEKLAPAGVTARELIEEFSGGMLPGHRFAAYLPGGASGGILPASLGDLPLDFGSLDAQGCFVGSGAVVILSDQDDLPAAVRNLVHFFKDESCGQCTPCRVGTAKASRMLDAPAWDRALLQELAAAMADGSICGLGQAAMNPVLSFLRHFPESVP